MTKRKSFILSDETINTYGFRMMTSGADLSEFQKNPVMLLNHDDWSLPIGRWENIRKEDGKILADPVFDFKDDRGKQVAQKVEDEFLKAASIGAWPPLELSEDPDLMLPGQTLPTVTKWIAREASIVTIGANHNALVFYDNEGNKIDLKDPETVLQLFDHKPNQHKPLTTDDTMSVINQLLKLADNAGEKERLQAVQSLIDRNTELTDSNAQLTAKVEEMQNAEKEEKTATAVSLTDAAVKDGRINADAKDRFLKLFDADFDNAKEILESLPKRTSVSRKIEEEKNTALGDLQKLSWDELDRAGRLVELRDKAPDLYKEKFKAKFGKEPKS